MKIFIFVISAFLAFSAWADDVAVPAGHVVTDECKQFIETIKPNYEYDWIKTKAVPEASQLVELFGKKKPKDSDGPLASEVTSDADVFVFYYYKKTALVNGFLKNPIAYFNGGPGYNGHGQSTLVEVAQVKHQLKSEFNFIYIDQRGTGCSSAYPTGVTRNVLELLKWYGSQGIVYDSELIRTHLLGNQKWKIFGQSYGAHVVYRYLSLFPQWVSKAYAHGNAIGITDVDRTYYRIQSQYTVTEAYLKVYPNDRRRLFALRLALSDKNKCMTNSLRDYCGYEMMTPLVSYLGFKDKWELVHGWLISLVPGLTLEDANLQVYANNFITSKEFYYREVAAPELSNHNMNVSLNFFGLYDWNTRPLTASICTKAYDRILTTLKLTEDALLIDECKAPMQFGYEDKVEPFILAQMPDFVPDFLKPEQVLEQIIKNKVAVFVYAGGTDCYVPKEAFALQNKIFGKKVSYTLFPNSGHEGYLTERQVFVDLLK